MLKLVAMKPSWFVAAISFSPAVWACDHPAAPAAPTNGAPSETVTPAAPRGVESPAPSSPEAPRGKRAPCTTDQSCNHDPSVSALWGHCVKETGVCECNAGFELHPGGSCQPIAK